MIAIFRRWAVQKRNACTNTHRDPKAMTEDPRWTQTHEKMEQEWGPSEIF